MSRLTGDERKRALEVALGKIEKDFGKGSVMRLGDQADRMQVEVIPTGCLNLDFALGVAGCPRGASSRSTARNPRARPPWPCTP